MRWDQVLPAAEWRISATARVCVHRVQGSRVVYVDAGSGVVRTVRRMRNQRIVDMALQKSKQALFGERGSCLGAMAIQLFLALLVLRLGFVFFFFFFGCWRKSGVEDNFLIGQCIELNCLVGHCFVSTFQLRTFSVAYDGCTDHLHGSFSQQIGFCQLYTRV